MSASNSLCFFLATGSAHFANLIFNNDGRIFLDNKASRSNIHLILYGLEVWIVCFKSNLHDYK